MPASPLSTIRWVATHILPQEPAVRATLRRLGASASDIDDLVQEAYCRFAALACVEHIDRPGAYFMQITKNLWRDQLRRAAVIRFEDITESAQIFVEPETMGVEATIAARQQLRLVEALLDRLPERCRQIFTLKRVEGWSQREIAQKLGVSESVVENDVQKALRLIQSALHEGDLLLGGGSPPQGAGYSDEIGDRDDIGKGRAKISASH